MHKKIIHCLVTGIILYLIVGCTVAPAEEEALPAIADLDSADDWQTPTPEEQGLDSALIADMLQDIQDRDLEIHSVLVIRHGYLVTEVYYPPTDQASKHPVYSISKSVASTMVGIAIQEGFIQSVGQPVLDFFPEIATDEYLKDLTIEHLLTMSAGYGTNTMPDLSSTLYITTKRCCTWVQL